LPTFKHIILVIQENRTPDNLFGGNPTFEPGVDIQRAADGQPWCLGACFNPGHGNTDWKNQNRSGGPACHPDHSGSCSSTTCNGLQVGTQIQLPSCTPDSYVSATYDSSIVAPYFDIAQKYGFANYFYQTNQGPSQPAHDFLFGGTSAPTGLNGVQYYNYFAASNPNGATQYPTGCDYPNGQTVPVVDPTGTIATNLAPCFDHSTLSDLLESANLSWKYYTNDFNDIWTAPNGIQHICLGGGAPPASCTFSDFVNHVVNHPSLILTDISPVTTTGKKITTCSLANVSWVIPNGTWSDHPGLASGQDSTTIEGGPNWVASIINTLGNSACLDTINGAQVPYWQDTAIFVVWDDWGGFYDHIQPFEVQSSQTVCPTAPWGCGYTYGFRVPLLVVSAFTPTGYVSGACGPGTSHQTCPKQLPLSA
jgi:phospholipase C